MSSSFARRLPFWILLALFGRAYTGVALAIPTPRNNSNKNTGPLRPGPVNARAESDFVTMYGLYDTSPPLEDSADGGPRLAPIPEVFVAMTQAATSTGTSEPTMATPTATAIYPLGSPPMQGPGLVVLSSTMLPGFTAPTPGPSATSISDAAEGASNRAVTPSGRVIILGSVIGGILFIALCVFLVLDPAITRKLCCCFCRLRKRSKEGKEDKGISHTSSWVNVELPKHSSIATEKDGSPSPKKGEDTLVDIPASPAPASKFSICSSEYLGASSRDSGVTSDSASSRTVKASVTFADGSAPVRPPRPPTADSPALSDSVYLACSDQPYVIIAPQPLTEADMRCGASTEPLKKLLTPSEFFALHVPGVLAGFSTKTDTRASSAVPERRVSYSRKRESQHSRAKSTPLLLGMASSRMSSRSSIVDFETDSGSIVSRVTKHRRSRSASGWAYPDRPKSKKFFNLS
ncbi:hypothetical protein BDZ97DRAFT_1824682 [Flammula alnicola]|nr:hypothetical protein BDZ97DRAFT_1824682 [Flammula alnicola]